LKQHTLKREERLKSRKTIARLFANEGKSFVSFPFKVVWLAVQVDEPPVYPAQMAVSVPSRNFPKATDRNLVKRRIKEAYRLHKSILYYPLCQTSEKPDEPAFVIALMFVYLGKEILPYKLIEQKVQICLKQLIRQIKPANSVLPDK